MKKIALFLVAMLIGLCCGCGETAGERWQRQLGNRPDIHINLKFNQGQVVDLKIGGKGQIISIDGKNSKPYRVRILTDDGPKSIWMNEWELTIGREKP